MFVSNKIEVGKTIKGGSLFAKSPIKKEEILINFEGKIISEPSRTTLQIDEDKFLEGSGEVAEYLNHSCEPNCYIDFSDLSLRALRDIKQGEELTFNYLTTEYDMAEKFQCRCGSKNCLFEIRGFKYLTLMEKKELVPWLSPYLKRKLQEEDK